MSEYTDIISDGGLDPRNAFDVRAAPTTLLEPVAIVGELYEQTRREVIAKGHTVGSYLYAAPPDAAAIIASKDAEIEQHRNNIAEFIRDADKKEETLRTEVERLTEKNQLLNSAFCESVDDVERLTRERDEAQNSRQREHDLRVKLSGDLEATREQLAAAQKDADRLDWMFDNPVEALDIFGNHHKDEKRFVRGTIDAAMRGKEGE